MACEKYKLLVFEIQTPIFWWPLMLSTVWISLLVLDNTDKIIGDVLQSSASRE